MRALHLDETFKPCGYDIPYKNFKFPGGETQTQIDIDFFDDVLITQVIRNADDIMEIALAVDAIRRQGIINIDLFIPYVPYARQDRVMQCGESLSIKVFAEMINSMFFREVYIFDPHSDVTAALINDCAVIDNHHFIEYVVRNLFPHNKEFYLICPDAGAEKKMKDLSKHLSTLHDNFQVIQCGKTRDVKTGEISNFEVYSDDLNFGGVPCLIVDDICDGGGTFIGLAHQLTNFSPGSLYLAVSHGIFSKGIESLQYQFREFYTTNSFHKKQVEKISTYQIQLEI